MLSQLKKNEDIEEEILHSFEQRNFDDRDDMYSSHGTGSSASSASFNNEFFDFQDANGISNRNNVTDQLANKFNNFINNNNNNNNKQNVPEQISLDKFKKDLLNHRRKINDENSSNDNLCVGCKNGVLIDNDLTKEFEGFAKIEKRVREHARLNDIKQLIEQIYDIYNEEIRDKISQALGEPPEPWEREDIKFHLEVCLKDAVVFQATQIGDLQLVLYQLKKEVLKKYSTDSELLEVNHDALKKMKLVMDMLKSLYSFNSEKSLTYNPRTAPERENQTNKKIKISHLNQQFL